MAGKRGSSVAPPRTRRAKGVGTLEHVTNHIEEWILSGDVEPGSRLASEQSLADRFGVSRPVIREALAQLRARRLVETVNGTGTFVASPDPEHLSDTFLRHLRAATTTPRALANMYEARLGVEVLTARLAAARSSVDDVTEIGAHVQAMRKAKGDWEAFTEHDMGFHLSVARASHNPFLVTLLQPLVGVIREIIFELQKDPGVVTDSVRGHTAVWRRIEARDADGAESAMRKHLADSLRYSGEVFSEH